MPKKSTDDFIREIIIPIEQTDVETGKLYAFINGMPTYDLKSNCYTLYEQDSYDDLWSFPTESNQGNWIEGNEIKLVTLSGVLWHGSKGGVLYEAEFEGENEKLSLHDFIIYMKPHNEYQENQMKGLEHINNCINLGVKVKKARLPRRVKNSPYLLWSFAIDCIEHFCNSNRNLIPEIYKRGIRFTGAYSKYLCGMGTLELEEMINIWTLPILRSDGKA